MAWDECAKYYADGNSAMVMSWSSRASLFELNNKSPAHLKTNYLPLPAAKENFQISPIGGKAARYKMQEENSVMSLPIKMLNGFLCG